MFWTIVAVLLILWLLGFTVVHAGTFIHALLIIALVAIISQVLSGRRIA